MTECAVFHSCSDGPEPCALAWAIGDMDRYIETLNPKYTEAREIYTDMRDSLVALRERFVSGDLRCSYCTPGPEAKDD